MDLASLQTLIIKLMAVITVSTSGTPINVPPPLSFVPQEALAHRVCGRPCPAYAVFLPKHGILIDARLDPIHDVHARGILLHELVHYVQWRRAGRQAAQNCQEWAAREEEAYSIQYRWLSKKLAGQLGYPASSRRPIVCVGPKNGKTQQAKADQSKGVAVAATQ